MRLKSRIAIDGIDLDEEDIQMLRGILLLRYDFLSLTNKESDWITRFLAETEGV